MPQLGVTINVLSNSTLKIYIYHWEKDTHGDAIFSNRIERLYIRAKDIFAKALEDTNTGEISLEMYEKDRLLATFTPTYPPNVGNSFEGSTNVTDIENNLNNFLANS
jgi:hypothetical protein